MNPDLLKSLATTFVTHSVSLDQWVKSHFPQRKVRGRMRARKAAVAFERLEDRTLLTTMFGVDNNDNLVTFDSATPGTVTTVAITGQGATEDIVGLSVRPATGQLYGVGLVDDGATRTGQIYTIDTATGVATAVGSPFSTTLPDTQFVGFDFNPVVDRIRFTNRDGTNLRVNPNDGTLAGTDTNLSSTGINGVAYTNPAGGTTTLFGLNFGTDDLVTIGNPSPNDGIVTTIGDTGIVALDVYGLDIDNVGVARATANGSLYSVNLGTGSLTLVGAIGGAPSLLGLTSAFTSLDIVGAGDDDTLIVTASGPNSGTYSLNGGAPVAFANVTSFSFLAGAGNDTLTIINPAGSVFAPAGGIFYNGEGNTTGDSLVLEGGGGATFNQIYNPSSPNDGVLTTTDGVLVQTVTFVGLEPITDTVVAASLTINGTAAADTINIIDGPAGTTQVNSPSFELINFANKTTVTVNALAGTDTVTVNTTLVAAGLVNLNVNGGTEADEVDVLAIPGITLNVDTNAGIPDRIVIGGTFATFNTGTGSISSILGTINLNDSGGSGGLFIDDSGNAASRTIIQSALVAVPVFGGPGFVINPTDLPGFINYTTGIDAFDLAGGSGVSNIILNATTASGITNVFGTGGDDIITVDGTGLSSATLNLFGGDGDDSFVINGVPTVGSDLNIDGQGQATPDGDSITMNGATIDSIRHFLQTSSSGVIEYDSDANDDSTNESDVDYVGLEPIFDNSNAVNRVFDFGGGDDSDVTIQDVGGADGVTQIVAPANAESVNFTAPTGSLTVNLGTGADVISVDSFDAAFPAIPINLNGESSPDEIRVGAVPTGASVNVNTAGGVPDVTVIGSVAGVATSLAQFNTGVSTLDGILGNVNVQDSGGVGELYVDDSGDATGRTFFHSPIAAVPTFGGPGFQINPTHLPGFINYTDNLETFQLATGSGADSIIVDGTNGDGVNTFFGNAGDDAFTILGDGLGGDNTFNGNGDNDAFVLNITTDLGTTNVQGPINTLVLDGGATTAGGSANRDRLTINDNNAGVARAMSFNYQSQSAGDIDITGFAITTEGLNLETVIANKVGFTNDVEVHGTGISSEDITVAPVDLDSALVFIGTDAAGGGWNGPPADFFTTLPGVAGGSFGPDLLINGIDGTGLQVFNNNAGGTTNHQVYVDGPSEDPVLDGTAVDQFGFGAGVIVPGFGAGNAFDDVDIDSTAGVSTVSITNTTFGPLVNVVLPQASDFTQNAPPVGEVNRPGLIVNSGFEAGLRPGTFLADDITADTSLQFYTKINGGNPVLTLDPVTGAPQGDQLNFTSIGDINVYSDGAPIPNVTVTDSVVAGTGISFSSIERSVNTPGSGTVNIIGDNNDAAVTQNDVFVVRGEVIPTIAQATPEEAHEAFSLQIGGNKTVPDGPVDLSARIYFIGVTRINANGGAAGETVDTGIDTLDITPYADNTPLGWGIETFWNEGDPVLDGDLLIFNGVNGVSDDITIAPSSPEAGQVFSINAATGTPIAVVNYVLNGAIIINGNTGVLGDTDKLTLRGTDGVSPSTSGNDSFDVDYDADGTAASPFIVVEDLDSGLLLYNLQDVTNLDVVHIDALAGFDEVTIDDTGAGAGGFQNTSLNIQMGDGADQVDASGSTTDRGYTINGGLGIDIIIGGEGDDLIDGGDADDFLSGNGGLNLIYGGLGNDIIFVDEEGVAGFTAIDGGEGVDAILFTGTAGVDAYSLGLGILPDSVGIITPNNEVNAASIENIEIDTGDDADTVDIADLTGTSLTQLTVDVGGAGDADVVTVEGRNSNDNLNLSTAGGDVTLAGLLYEIIIAAATPAARIVINANEGDDTIKANAGVETVIGITLNGEEGNDNLSADAILNGGAGDDTLQGGAGDDTINGNDGDDTILFSAGGTDAIDGGAGFDRFIIESGNGNTTMNISEAAVTVDGGTETFSAFDGMELVLVNATAGADNITVGLTAVNGVILGGYGDDVINGTTSTVPLIIDGGLGNDTLTGGSAADTIYGVDGNDTIVGGDGADTLNGGVGNDNISGGLGDDNIDGGDGFDTLTGGVGADSLIGGGDGDNFILATGDGEDYIDGGSGPDWVTFNSTGGAVDVELATNGYNITTATNDADIYGVEELDIDGTAAANQITIGDLTGSGLEFLNLELSAAADTVTVNGQNSADDITVSSPAAGEIEIDGLAFEMLIEATAAADTLTVNGNEGNDVLKANEGVEAQIGIVLDGGAGNDFLSADATLLGGTGNDTLQGGNGPDTIDGGAGDDTILFSPGAGVDNITGGTGFDRILVNGTAAANNIIVTETSITVDADVETITVAGIEQFEVNGLGGDDTINVTLTTATGLINGGEGADVIVGTGSATALTINGGDGNDTITGGTAADVIEGGLGNDSITGGAGADQMAGGDGADVFFWSPGDGSDVVAGGGDGADRLEFNGNAAANVITLAATPGHATVNLGAATVDTTGVENLQINALAGGDTVTVGDLSTSVVSSVAVDLGAGDTDAVFVHGRTTADDLAVTAPSITTLKIQGLAYDLNIANVALPDSLTVNGNQGDDSIKASSGVENTVNITFNGGEGNDFLSADAILNGDAGNDTLVGGVGADQLNGGDGDDFLTGNGGIDAFDGGAGYDTIVETRDANFTLTNTTLIVGAEGTDTVTLVENAYLTGGLSANLFTIGAFTGDTTVKGNGGSDTVDFSTATQAIHIDLDAVGQDQIINLDGRTIVFADTIENLNATPFNDTINVDIAQFNRTINGGLETSIPPGDRLNVDLLGSNASSTKVPNGGKLGSFNGTVNGSGFTGTISYFDIETLVIKGANSTPPDFSSATQYDMGDGPRGVITADFNGDGILDMATANSKSNNISVRLGDGFGNFGAVTNYSAGGKSAKQTTTIAGGDVDGDGDIDLVVTNRKTNNVSVLLGNGDGTFGTATLYATGVKKTGKFPTGVKLGDMNGDGNLDIVTANSNVGKNGSFSILLGDGAGNFGTANVTATQGRRPRDLELIDVDGDTNLDVVATNLFSRSVFVLNGNGAGGLSGPTSYDVAVTPNSIISGDFNGDGILDVVTTSLVSPRLSLLLGNGSGFDPVKEIKYPATKLDISINTADINGDGNLDLLIANRNDNTVSYMLGNGNGSFQNRVDFKTGNTIFREPVSIAVGDFNNDGAIDLMVANAGSDDVSVLIHVGIV